MFLRVLRNTLLLYRDAYAILKAAAPSSQVGPIHAMIPVFPADPDSEEDQLLARNFEALFNDLPLRALCDGVIAIPGERLLGSTEFSIQRSDRRGLKPAAE
jgi:beta-glucosidase/6-phospho-beta-glucosidase/beta-galactosidase